MRAIVGYNSGRKHPLIIWKHLDPSLDKRHTANPDRPNPRRRRSPVTESDRI